MCERINKLLELDEALAMVAVSLHLFLVVINRIFSVLFLGYLVRRQRMAVDWI